MKLKTKITGSKVHEVGYRVFLLRKAIELGVERFNAYNTKEDEKQVLISFLEGDESQLVNFKEFTETNRPENAEVLDVAFEDYGGYIINVVDYMHLFTAEQLSKGIPAILSIDRKMDRSLEKQDSMLEKQDSMLEKQDSMLEKQDSMLEKQDSMLEKQDSMLEKLDETKREIVGEIREMRWDLKSYLDEKLKRIDSDIAQIKAKIGI